MPPKRPAHPDRGDGAPGQGEPLPPLTDPGFRADPYPAFARARRIAPLRWHPTHRQWWLLSHPAVDRALRDRRFGRLWRDREPVERFAPFNAIHRHQMMENEPPEHTRLRSLVASAFSRGHVERLRPRTAELARQLLDAAGPEFDLVADLAEPLPVRVIAELLGIAEPDWPLLRPWSAAIVGMYEAQVPPEAEAAAVRAAAEFSDYVRHLARQRLRDPGGDLLSHLVVGESATGGGRLSEEEVVASAILLLNAGHEATANAIGNAVVALLRHPDQLRLLRQAPPQGLPAAVAETLRYDPPLQLFERTAIRPLRLPPVPGGDPHGVLIEAGQTVALLLGAANHDPAVFRDPDRLDLTRAPNPHLVFGAGRHFCLGSQLALLEVEAALTALLRRAPRLELAAPPVRRESFVMRGFREIHLRLR